MNRKAHSTLLSLGKGPKFLLVLEVTFHSQGAHTLLDTEQVKIVYLMCKVSYVAVLQIDGNLLSTRTSTCGSVFGLSTYTSRLSNMQNVFEAR